MRINLLTIILIALSFQFSFAQVAYNPFVHNIHYGPEPTQAGFPCQSFQKVIFDAGLTTLDDAPNWQTQPLKIHVCLTGFTYVGDLDTLVSGTYHQFFDWQLDSINPLCVIGTQNQLLHGTGPDPFSQHPNALGDISIVIRVNENQPQNTPIGVTVTLVIPPYMQIGNSIGDDQEISITQTFFTGTVLTSAGSIAGSTIFCAGGNPGPFPSVTLGGSSTGNFGILYQWQEKIGNTWTDIPGATDTTYDAPATIVSRYYRRNAKRFLCDNWVSTDSVSVTIDSLPVVGVNAGFTDTLDCLNPSKQIGITNIPGATYSWVPAVGLSSTSSSLVTATPLVTTNYILTVVDSNGCVAVDSVLIIKRDSVYSLDAGADKYLTCTNPSDPIGPNNVSGVSYSWNPPLGLSASNIAQPVASPPTTTTYYVTMSDIYGCVKTDSVHVFTTDSFSVANAGPGIDLNCTTPSGLLGKPAIVGSTYSWQPSIGLSSTTSAQPIASPSITTVYTLTLVDSNGCISTDTVLVSADKVVPMVNLGGPLNLCLGDSVQIGDNSVSNLNVSWSPPDGLSNPNQAVTMAKPSATTVYTLTVNGSNGCTTSSSVLVNVQPCLINISGYVFHDTTSLTNTDVDGIGIANPGGVQLYIALSNNKDTVIAYTTVGSNGFYEFNNVVAFSEYKLTLLSTLPSTNNLTPIPTLPLNWSNTGEDCCDSTGNDGQTDGLNVVQVAGSSRHRIDFGITYIGTPLSVQLLDFKVFNDNCNAVLWFTLLQETENIPVEVFRSTNGNGSFQKIGSLTCSGNVNEMNHFSFIDNALEPTNTYGYSLKLYSLDGINKLSQTKYIEAHCDEEANNVMLYPNPSTDKLHVLFTKAETEDITLELFDFSGRKIMSQQFTTQQGIYTHQININQLSKGSYTLKYSNTDGSFNGRLKFVKL